MTETVSSLTLYEEGRELEGLDNPSLIFVNALKQRVALRPP